MLMIKHTCSKEVYTYTYWNPTKPCGKSAKYFESGRWYCGFHAPSQIEKRKKKKGKLSNKEK